MRIYGLTGGIACGKSTVANMFEHRGVKVVDADLLAREVVEPGSDALAEIAREYGPGVLTDDGELDRKALGDIVFGDDAAREKLGAITHPRIAALSQQRLAALRESGEDWVIYEAPLLVENNLHLWMDGLIVVSAPESVQLARLMARDGIDEAAARARIGSQLPLADKLALADHVIDNSGTREQTAQSVRQLFFALDTAGHSADEKGQPDGPTGE